MFRVLMSVCLLSGCQSDIETCRGHLLTVAGVISITFDVKTQRVVLRTRADLQPEVCSQFSHQLFSPLLHWVCLYTPVYPIWSEICSIAEDIWKVPACKLIDKAYPATIDDSDTSVQCGIDQSLMATADSVLIDL